MSEKTILVVDDEPDLTDMLRIKLSRAGYRVRIATTGSEALAALTTEKPDLIVLDVMIPPPDGYKVCRILKASRDFQDIPIIMLSAKGMRDDVSKGYAAGADSYLTKPIKARELLKKIAEVLSDK